jgi:hypothetical protein
MKWPSGLLRIPELPGDLRFRKPSLVTLAVELAAFAGLMMALGQFSLTYKIPDNK